LHTIVCIKSVVTEAPKGRINRSADKCALNPFDRPPLEKALALKERHGGSVTVLSMGPPTAESTLREALALGADRAVLLCDPALAGADTLATATALAAAVNHLAPFDLLLFGIRTTDSDTGQVGPQTAVLLDIPMLTTVSRLDEWAPTFTATREVDGFTEIYALDCPAALTIHPDAAKPRETPLAGLAAAFDQASVIRLSAADVGLDPATVGEAGSPTRVLSVRPVKKNRTCKMIEGTAAEQANLLVDQLTSAGLLG
jgi:electron transfer flavoprotein beta subunit